MSTSRVSTRPAFASRSSSSSNSLSGSATRSPRTAHLVPGGVEAHVADLEHLAGLRDPVVVAAPAPQRRAHPRHELAQAERLRHVVVGADLEPDDRVDLGVARGDHDDRHLRA